METFVQIRQEVISQVQGGVYTDETKFEPSFVDALIHQARANLLKDQRMINEMWVSEYNPVYSIEFQEGDYCEIKIEIPTPINFTFQGDGILYLGGVDGRSPFKRLGYTSSVSTAYQHPKTRPSQEKVSYSLSAKDTNFLYAKIYGNPSIEDILVRVVAFDPTLIPNYRIETDLYPISGDLLIQLKTNVLNNLMAQMAGTPADTLGNTADGLNEVYKALNNLKRGR